ncbi:MAG: alpha/beta hydrolase [Acidobacteriota bacterium]|nr:alpha/beta hydrolase [Acidobacteriota bacterium]
MLILFTSLKKLPLLFFSLFLSLSVIGKAQSEPARPPILGKLVDAGGYRVHIYCTGAGSPTVVVAGGGFSFDWGLVQPEVAKFARVCTYDAAGTAWSDRVEEHPHQWCADRIGELHTVLKNAGIESPYVVVGFSIGALVARLYAIRYPAELFGMVLVDHAFTDTDGAVESSAQDLLPPAGLDSPPILISKTPIALDLEDDRNFSKLPERGQELHRWTLSIHSVRPTVEMADECFSEVDASEHKLPFPLGNMPLVVVSTLYDSPRYKELQRKLLMLSHNSEQLFAKNSSHMVIIDQPEIVVRAIQEVVKKAKSRTGLKK